MFLRIWSHALAVATMANITDDQAVIPMFTAIVKFFMRTHRTLLFYAGKNEAPFYGGAIWIFATSLLA